jgi:RimJ/RimL family protein N-acetyltransferase
MNGPVLETARLRLRVPTIEDFDDLHALTAGPEMRKHLTGEANVEDDYRRLLANLGGWATFGFGNFCMVERETGELVGNCGVFRMLRGLGEGFDGHPEAGWITASSRWGRGYATEAMQAAIDWFEREHKVRHTVCMIVPGNHASEAIAARLCYRPTRRAEHRGEKVQLYARAA